jgi:hypothetical protein
MHVLCLPCVLYHFSVQEQSWLVRKPLIVSKAARRRNGTNLIYNGMRRNHEAKYLKCSAFQLTEVCPLCSMSVVHVVVVGCWAHLLTPIWVENKEDRNFISLLFVEPRRPRDFGLGVCEQMNDIME